MYKRTTLIPIIALFMSVCAFAKNPTIFECKSETIADSGKFLFAYDENGRTAGLSRPGFCELYVDKTGNPIGDCWCWVDETRTIETQNHELAILLSQSISGGTRLFRHLNLPTNFLEMHGGKGLYLSGQAAPANLAQSIGVGGSEITCEEKDIQF